MPVIVVEDILMEIIRQYGDLTPEILLKEATDPAHPLHDRFDWNDQSAAQQHRLNQARQLIRSVKVTVKTASEDVEVRRFIHVKTGTASNSLGSYMPVEVIAESKTLTEITKLQMERDWKALRKKYANHAAFWDMIERDRSDA